MIFAEQDQLQPQTAVLRDQLLSVPYEDRGCVGTGCTVHTFSAVGLLPPEGEKRLSELKVGEALIVQYSSVHQGLYKLFENKDLSSTFDSDTEEKVGGENEETKKDDNIKDEGKEGNSKVENEVVKEVEVYSFKILLTARKRVLNPALVKRVKPNLFYPSLSVQVP